MAVNSRAKGARGERELANILKEHGYDARRGQQFCGANGDADVIGLPGYHIECKRTERLEAYKFMEQSSFDAREGEIPLVIYRKNGGEWLVIEKLKDWLEEKDG